MLNIVYFFQSWWSWLDDSLGDLDPISPMALINGEISHSPLPEVSSIEAEAVVAEAEREVPPTITIRPQPPIQVATSYPRELSSITSPFITERIYNQSIIPQVFTEIGGDVPRNITVVPVINASPIINIQPRPTIQGAMRPLREILPAVAQPIITQPIYLQPIIPQVFYTQPTINQPIVTQSVIPGGSGTLSGGRKRKAAPTPSHMKPKKAKSGCRKYNALLIY